jgi:hypothetical protein
MKGGPNANAGGLIGTLYDLKQTAGKLASSSCTTAAPNVCAFWLNCKALNMTNLLQR